MLLELTDHLRSRLIDIGDQSVIGDSEDWCIRIVIDRNDRARVLHSGQVLNGATDPCADVEVGGHNLAGLSDLKVVWHPACITCGSGRAHAGAKGIGKVFNELESLYED